MPICLWNGIACVDHRYFSVVLHFRNGGVCDAKVFQESVHWVNVKEELNKFNSFLRLVQAQYFFIVGAFLLRHYRLSGLCVLLL